jgi:SAM-dependent methyltransferase
MSESTRENAYQQVNASIWDTWVKEKCTWTVPMQPHEVHEVSPDNYSLFLTPTKRVPDAWLGQIRGRSVLALACGGGQQVPVLAALGAQVTVLDNSPAQLETERLLAAEAGYAVSIVRHDMTDPLPFESGKFDLVVNPVSNSYVATVPPLWAECARVLRQRGHLIAGFANPIVYLFDVFDQGLRVSNKIPFDPREALSASDYDIIKRRDGVQFGHTLEAQIAGQTAAGFQIIDMYEDYHPETTDVEYDTFIGAIASRLSKYIPIYIATCAVKGETQTEPHSVTNQKKAGGNHENRSGQ